MNIICTQENLKKSLFSLEHVVGKKSTLPILENILIEVKNGIVSISATNLELGAVIYLAAKIEKEGKITVPVKILSLFIGNLPGDSIVNITVQDLEMHLKSGNHTAVIQGLDSEDFPIIPRINENLYETQLDARIFRDALHKNIVSVSPSNIRVEFSGIFLCFKENILYMVSTDSFRLIETQISFHGNGKIFEQGIILPFQTVSEVMRLITEDIHTIKIAIQEGQIFFQMGESVFLVSRLIQGNFPDYKQIIPQVCKTTVQINKETLLQAIRLALAFLGGATGEVLFSLDKNENRLTVFTESEKTGKNKSVIPVKIVGEDLSIIFNPKYILDAIQIIDGDEITLSLNSESSPTIFSSEKQKSGILYQYILMPIKK